MYSYIKVIKPLDDFRKNLIDKIDNGKRLDKEKMELLNQVEDDLWERYERFVKNLEEEIEIDKKILNESKKHYIE